MPLKPQLTMRKKPWRRSCIVLLAALAASLAPAAPLQAIGINGNIRAWIGNSRSEGVETEDLEQTFSLNLSQEITPLVRLYGSYRYNALRTRFDLSPEFERTSEEPLIGLDYSRPNFDARVNFQDRAIRTSDRAQDLDVRQLLASLDWRPARGPWYFLRFRDGTSTVDPTTFGRDTDSRFLDVGLLYRADSWTARYTYGSSQIDSGGSGVKLDQDRHEARLTWDESFLQNRWTVGVDTRYARFDQNESLPAGSLLTQPVPARLGLFAVDPSPTLGELESRPDLIDGNTTTPVAPRIEIGGANTFRNLGVDLGLTRPLSELEISVDQPSGAAVVWEVYESPDNLSWFPIAAVESRFDAGFLHYRIRFPETTSRYFKAVNVSANPVADVAVTEIRALLTQTTSGSSNGTGDQYWVDLSTAFRPHRRIQLSLNGSLRNDQSLNSTVLTRDLKERSVSGQLRTLLTETLELRLGYLYSELEERIDPVLARQEEQLSAVLQWRPRSTVDMVLRASQSEERDGAVLISESEGVLLRLLAELLPSLRLTSELGFSDSNDPLFGSDRQTTYWTEQVEMRPTERWIIYARLSQFSYDSTGAVAITSRSVAELSVNWLVTPFLTVNTDWTYGEDDIGQNLTQRHGFRWAPGDRFSMSLSYNSTESRNQRGVESLTGNLNYRFYRWVNLWATANDSQTAFSGQQRIQATSYRVGMSLIF